MTSFRSLARNRDFTALWIGQTISELGSSVSLFVFPLIGYAMTGSPMLAALVETVHLLGRASAMLPAGLLADRYDRRRIMRLASGSGLLLYASLAGAGLAGMLALPQLLVVALLEGVVAGVFGPAEMSAVRTVVPRADLPTALAQNQARQHVASLVGAPLGGLLYSVTRWFPFAANAVSYAVAWLMLGRLRTDLSAEPVAGPRRARRELAEGFGFIARHPLFRILTCWSACSNLVINALFLAAMLRLIQAGFHPVQIGLVDTAAGAFGILGAIVAPWLIDRFPTGRLTVLVAWSFVPLLLPMVFWNNPAVVAAALSAGLFLNPAGNAGIGAYRLAVTPSALVGRVQATTQFVGFATMPLAPVLAGALLSGLGGPRAIAVLCLACVGTSLIPTLSRSVRRVPRPGDWTTEVDAGVPAPPVARPVS